MNAIILHGLAGKEEYFSNEYPTGSNSHWLPWLQKQLMINGIKADTPEVPEPFSFNWDSWAKEVERFEITPETILVGHSMGGGFWVKYLSEHPEISVAKLVLVAPWLNPDHERNTDFFDFRIDTTIQERCNELIIFASDNDMQSVQDSIAFLQNKIPTATLRTFHDYGHFTMRSMKTDVFPELLKVILS